MVQLSDRRRALRRHVLEHTAGRSGFAAAIAASGTIAGFVSLPALVPLITGDGDRARPAGAVTGAAGVAGTVLRFYESARANVLSEVTGGVVGIAAALAGNGVWALLAHRITVAAMQNASSWWKARSRPSLRWSSKAILSMWAALGGQLRRTSVTFPATPGLALSASRALFQVLILASIRQAFHIWNAMLRALGSPNCCSARI